MSNPFGVRALTFDVFGTVVDWRSSVAREMAAFAAHKGIALDAMAFAMAWRGRYQPALSRVRDGEVPWVRLDDLHRESLLALLDQFGVADLEEDEIDHLVRIWHRLDPWPDSVPGLIRLRRRFVLATLSNGNVSLMVNLARSAGLPWDAVLGAEVARAYKPQDAAYLTTAALLDLEPARCMMVAAHNYDLRKARALGFRTAFVPRPTEYGPHQKTDLEADEDWDVVASSMLGLADRLGC